MKPVEAMSRDELEDEVEYYRRELSGDGADELVLALRSRWQSATQRE